MDLRKRRTHPIDKLPLLTTRWRLFRRSNGAKCRVKMIKVAHTYGERSTGKWVNYSRWLYEQHKGPVPQGKRVIHKDGDLTNFDLDNLILGGPADVLWVHCHKDPVKSAANRAACSAGAARYNRESASVRRELAPLPSRWYAVDLTARVIVNTAGRKLHDATGYPSSANGSGLTGWRLGYSGLPAADASMLAVLLRVAGPRSLAKLVPLIEDLRRELRIEPARLSITSLRTAGVRLVKSGWAERVGRGVYRATGKARTERGPICPYVFVVGDELLADPQYRAFAFVSQNLSR